MSKFLPMKKMPLWLHQAEKESRFDLQDILRDSLYYPACESDGFPVKYLGGYIYSFVYVDYCYAREKVLQDLYHPHRGFLKYDVVFTRHINLDLLFPRTYRPLRPDDMDGLERRQWYWKESYAVWSVLKRKHGYTNQHGPEKFSFLYLAWDGVDAFNALYRENNCRPEIVTVIQPGLGFGCNWTDFYDQNMIFARTVLQNPAGIPPYLLSGGGGNYDRYCPACWDMYKKEIARASENYNSVILWGQGK